MEFSWPLVVDVVVFLGFVVTVITVGILKSRHEEDSEAYFLAGRGLSWWLIGFSLIAANISTEQFVGMSGSAADATGLAIASYEWIAAITLVVVAFCFLPAFLRSGIYTMPEFLEYRYNHQARSVMSLFMMIMYVGVTIAAVIYSGAKTMDTVFSGKQILGGLTVSITTSSWIIGILAAIYVVSGGLKACAWADLLQGSALILGGALMLVLAMRALGAADPGAIGVSPEAAQDGAWTTFRTLNADKLHMVLPMADKIVPWTALVVGLWIPNFYYWGLNQYITQRTLGARSLGEGQKGIVFAAGLKLLIPFVVVFPGIIAFNLFRSDMKESAATKEEKNKTTLERFDAVKDAPGEANVAFQFNKDYAELYPETGRAIVAFNSRVARVEAPADLDGLTGQLLSEANEAPLSRIKEINKAAPWTQRAFPWSAPRVDVQKELVGYDFDAAFPTLIKRLTPPGLAGFMLAAILGAVMSSLAAMLNAASTIFTMDIYREYLHRNASQRALVLTGRMAVMVFVVIGCLIAPWLGHPRFGGIFKYIQEFQGFVSPGILGVFLFGLYVKRAPRSCGVVGLLLSPAVYGILMFALPDLAFLDRMAVTFFAVLVAMGVLTLAKPLREPVVLPTQTKISLSTSKGAVAFGLIVVAVTLALYWYFW